MTIPSQTELDTRATRLGRLSGTFTFVSSTGSTLRKYTWEKENTL